MDLAVSPSSIQSPQQKQRTTWMAHALSLEQFCSDSHVRCGYGVIADGLRWMGAQTFCNLPTEIREHEEIAMGKVIEFYVPRNFRTPLKGASPQRGKVIEICAQIKKSA